MCLGYRNISVGLSHGTFRDPLSVLAQVLLDPMCLVLDVLDHRCIRRLLLHRLHPVKLGGRPLSQRIARRLLLWPALDVSSLALEHALFIF